MSELDNLFPGIEDHRDTSKGADVAIANRTWKRCVIHELVSC